MIIDINAAAEFIIKSEISATDEIVITEFNPYIGDSNAVIFPATKAGNSYYPLIRTLANINSYSLEGYTSTMSYQEYTDKFKKFYDSVVRLGYNVNVLYDDSTLYDRYSKVQNKYTTAGVVSLIINPAICNLNTLNVPQGRLLKDKFFIAPSIGEYSSTIKLMSPNIALDIYTTITLYENTFNETMSKAEGNSIMFRFDNRKELSNAISSTIDNLELTKEQKKNLCSTFINDKDNGFANYKRLFDIDESLSMTYLCFDRELINNSFVELCLKPAGIDEMVNDYLNVYIKVIENNQTHTQMTLIPENQQSEYVPII